MKNLKRVVALVISLVFVMSTVAFADGTTTTTSSTTPTTTTTDTKSTDTTTSTDTKATDTKATDTTATDTTAADTVSDAQRVLAEFNIMTGTDKGFEGDKALTRAEAARIMYSLAVSFGGEVSATNTSFADTPSTHWASGYIANLNGYKVNGAAVINGKSANSFDPDSNVSYDQFNTMLTIALGYYPYAKESGGYPGGYKAAAIKAKLYDAAFGEVSYKGNADITRNEVATLLANALIAYPVKKQGYGSSAEYVDGDKPYITEEHDIDLTVGTLRLNNKKYDLTAISDNDKDYNDQYVGKDKSDLEVASGVDGLQSAIDSVVSRRTVVFYKGNYIKAIGAAQDRNTLATTNNVKKYFFNSGTNKISVDNVKNYSVSSNVRVTVNGVDVSSPIDVQKLEDIGSLATNSNDGQYVKGYEHVSVAIYGQDRTVDEIAIQSYSYGKVDSTSNSSNKVKLVGEKMVNSKTYTVNDTSKEDTDSLTKNGATINVSDLQKDKDIIKVAVIPAQGTKSGDEDIYALSVVTKTLSGTASSSKHISTTSNNNDVKDNHLYYKIDGNYYAVNTWADKTNVDNTAKTDQFDMKLKDLSVGDNGTFTITPDNEIVGFDESTGSGDSFIGYLSYVGWATGSGRKLTFDVNIDGKSYEYTTKDVLGDGKACDDIVIALGKAKGITLDAVNNSDNSGNPDGKVDVKKDPSAYDNGNKVTNDLKTAAVNLIDGIGDEGDLTNADPNLRFISLKFDSNNNPSEAKMEAQALVQNKDGSKDLEYKKSLQALTSDAGNSIYLDDDANVYVVDNDKLVKNDISYLQDKTNYDSCAPILDTEDDTKPVTGVVIAGGTDTNKYKYAMAIKDGESTSEHKSGATNGTIDAYVKGEEVTLYSEDDDSCGLRNIKAGEYFQYTENASNEVDDINVIANSDDFAFQANNESTYKEYDMSIASAVSSKLLSSDSKLSGFAICLDYSSPALTFTTDKVSAVGFNPKHDTLNIATGAVAYVYDVKNGTVDKESAKSALSDVKDAFTIDNNNTAVTTDDQISAADYNGIYVRRATADDDNYDEGEAIEVVMFTNYDLK